MKHDPRTCATCRPFVDHPAALRGAARAAADAAGEPIAAPVPAPPANPALALLQETR